MLKSIGTLLVAAVILFIEVPPLMEKKYKKELIVFSILLIFGVGLGVAYSFDVQIPNPIDLLTFIYKPLHDVVSR